MTCVRLIILSIFGVLLHPANGWSAPLPRTVIALYDGNLYADTVKQTYIHRRAEMVLNHLGLVVEYHNMRQTLPEIAGREDVRGIITWFDSPINLDDPFAYVEWVSRALDKGKKLVILGNPGIYTSASGAAQPRELTEKLLNRIGLNTPESWVEYSWGHQLKAVNEEAAHALDTLHVIPGYPRMALNGANTTPHIAIIDTEQQSWPVVATHPNGGMVVDGFDIAVTDLPTRDVVQWIVNPFTFFREAFATHDLPKPDTTTLTGQRLYYSHIDGDGWNNLVQFTQPKQKPILSAQSVMEELIKPYPDLPVSLTLIAADVDPAWVGSEESIAIAKEFLALPQVEAGSHTYSHPFFWQFFADGNADKERPFLDRYPFGRWDTVDGSSQEKPQKAPSYKPVELPDGYTAPRAFANFPFSIEQEITGSLDYIQSLLPEGKKVQLVTWTGNTTPFERALALTREYGAVNINGGDSRFDPEYPDVANVSPIGLKLGNELQIYASASNENTYTDYWRDRYYAYRFLKATLENTESPTRLKPINVYYHLYSGEHKASLRALREMLDYARTQPIIPVAASHYGRIAEGFFSSKIDNIGERAWRISERGALNTVRFDYSAGESVNFSRSSGVIGQKRFQDSLYVHLNPDTAQPVIYLHKAAPSTAHIWLEESRWPVTNATLTSTTRFSFQTSGYGEGTMRWHVPHDGQYSITVEPGETRQAKAKDGILPITLPAGFERYTVTVSRDR